MNIKTVLIFFIGLILFGSSCSVQDKTQTDIKRVTKELDDNEELEYSVHIVGYTRFHGSWVGLWIHQIIVKGKTISYNILSCFL